MANRVKHFLGGRRSSPTCGGRGSIFFSSFCNAFTPPPLPFSLVPPIQAHCPLHACPPGCPLQPAHGCWPRGWAPPVAAGSHTHTATATRQTVGLGFHAMLFTAACTGSVFTHLAVHTSQNFTVPSSEPGQETRPSEKAGLEGLNPLHLSHGGILNGPAPFSPERGAHVQQRSPSA